MGRQIRGRRAKHSSDRNHWSNQQYMQFAFPNKESLPAADSSKPQEDETKK